MIALAAAKMVEVRAKRSSKVEIAIHTLETRCEPLFKNKQDIYYNTLSWWVYNWAHALTHLKNDALYNHYGRNDKAMQTEEQII